MIKKEKERIRAIGLRKKGLSYREILEKIPVAKSSLSLWLQSVGLSKKQKQRLTDKKLASARKGGLAKKNQRLLRMNKIISEAERDVGILSKRELWLMGTCLYWAEGSKEKEDRPGSGVQFMNHDPLMIRLFLQWLINICKIEKERVGFDIYIHEYRKPKIEEVVRFWSYNTGFPANSFSHIYYKKNNLNNHRKNIGDKYFGGLKVRVTASSELNRKIRGWVSGICKNCRVV